MTIQDLKNNREAIINFINSNNYDLKFAMGIAAEICVNCDDLQELYIELENHCKPVKSSKLAELHSNAHIDEKYNVITKEFQKI
jgi:hypothetical protein